MGITNTLVNSTVKVIAGLLGFAIFMAGGQQAMYGSDTVGTIMALVGIILMVFAAKL